MLSLSHKRAARVKLFRAAGLWRAKLLWGIAGRKTSDQLWAAVAGERRTKLETTLGRSMMVSACSGRTLGSLVTEKSRMKISPSLLICNRGAPVVQTVLLCLHSNASRPGS